MLLLLLAAAALPAPRGLRWPGVTVGAMCRCTPYAAATESVSCAWPTDPSTSVASRAASTVFLVAAISCGVTCNGACWPGFLPAAFDSTRAPTETRAWTIKKGFRAPQAAGVIHDDFERGFIKAETIGCQELLEVGNEKVAKEKGLIRMEGKEYIVQDGDVMLFRFNV